MLTQSFADAVVEAEKIITGAPHIATEADLAEGYDYLAATSGRAAAGLGLPAGLPVLRRLHRPVHQAGPGQPGHPVLHSYLRDDAEYVVTGRRGSTADLSFQVLERGLLARRGAGQPDRVRRPGDRDRRRRHVRAAVRPARAGPGRRDYVTLGPGSAMLLVREVYSDWAREQRGTISIRRADRAGCAPPAPDTARWPSATGWRARSCCPGCGPSWPSPSGST